MCVKRKITSVALCSVLALTLASCSSRPKLLFLNWGEYIDDTMVEAFEEKYHVDVVMDVADSNEIFYSKVKSGNTIYDVVCPSDYMVEKMYRADLIQEIDFSKLALSEYTPESSDLRYGVQQIMNNMEENTKDHQEEQNISSIKNYFVPYLWGTWCIAFEPTEELYNAVTQNENQWACLFDRSILPSGTTVAMYDSHQHAYYAAMRYLYHSGYQFQTDGVTKDNVTSTELGVTDLNKLMSLIKGMNYDAWGTDNIKKEIVDDHLDLGFMWTGDALYYYADQIATIVNDAFEANDVELENVKAMIDAMTDQTKPSPERKYITASGNEYMLKLDIFIPDDTLAFCDNLVITKDAAHYNLALKFIDFLTSNSVSSEPVQLDGDFNEIEKEEPSDIEFDELEPSFTNTYYVDYDAVFTSVYDELVDLKNTEIDSEEDLYDLVYDYVIGIAFDNFYSRDEYRGKTLTNFSRDYIKTINKTFNNARV